LIAGESPHPRVPAEELGQIVTSRSNPPLRSVRPEIPDSVARLVDRCVRREPSERYASAEALVAEIEDVKTVFLPHTGTEAPVALERDAVAVAGSFARVAPHLDRFTTRLYERLFGSHPELRSLFPAQMDAQRVKLAHALRLTVEGLHEPERLVPALEDLGRRHGHYKVPLEGDGIFEGILLETLKEFEQGQWNESLEQGGARALGFIPATMQRGQGLARSTQSSGSPSGSTAWRPGTGAAPRTRWADAGGVSIAYQEFGEGPRDIVLAFGWLTHVEMAWRHPTLAGFLR